MKKNKHQGFNLLYDILAVAFALIFIVSMLLTVRCLPDIGEANNPTNNEVSEKYLADASWETGSLNAVSGMILDYRAFDTLGESCVLFVATTAVFIMLRRDEDSPEHLPVKHLNTHHEPVEDPILKQSFTFLIPVIFLFGIYVILNGHLSPGGGFSGGAIIGAGFILYLNAFGLDKTERFINSKTYLAFSVCALLFYGLAKSYVFYIGANHIESIIPVLADGSIFASGLILPLNIAVGIVVANTVYALYLMFRRGGFNK